MIQECLSPGFASFFFTQPKEEGKRIEIATEGLPLKKRMSTELRGLIFQYPGKDKIQKAFTLLDPHLPEKLHHWQFFFDENLLKANFICWIIEKLRLNSY